MTAPDLSPAEAATVEAFETAPDPYVDEQGRCEGHCEYGTCGGGRRIVAMDQADPCGGCCACLAGCLAAGPPCEPLVRDECTSQTPCGVCTMGDLA